MKSIMKYISALFAAALILTAALCVTVCAADDAALTASRTTLYIGGDELEIKAALPAEVTYDNSSTIWASSDSSVVISESEGLSAKVKAAGIGSADITFSVTIGGDTYTGQITIKAEAGVPDVKFDFDSYQTSVGDFVSVPFDVTENGQTGIEYSVSVENKKVADVMLTGDNKIIVTGEALGVTKVYVSYKFEGVTARKNFIVVVKAPPSSDFGKLTMSSQEILAKRDSAYFLAVTLPFGTSLIDSYSWSVASSDVKLTVHGEGDAVTIYVPKDAKSGTYTITVSTSYKENVSGLMHLNVKANAILKIPAEEEPSKNTAAVTSGTSSETKVTTVSEAEKAVKRLKAGTVVLSGKAAEKGITANMSKYLFSRDDLKVKAEGSGWKYTVTSKTITSKKAEIRINPTIKLSSKKNSASIKLSGSMKDAKSVSVQFTVKALGSKKLNIYMDGKKIAKVNADTRGRFSVKVTPEMMGKTLTVKLA